MHRKQIRPRFRRPELSQHFIRPGAARRLVGKLPLEGGELVVEPGAGDGRLTEALVDAGFRVIAIEKDARLYRALRERLVGRTNVECHHADFLSFRLPAACYHVVSNVPYGTTSLFVRRLLHADPPPETAHLVLQREAAEKFAGRPEETLFSLLYKPWFHIEITGRIRRTDFEPPPAVESVVLQIRQRGEALVPHQSAGGYRQFVRAHFGHGAPQIARSLRRTFTGRQVRRLSQDLGFRPEARSSELTFEQWLGLFRFWCCGGQVRRSSEAR